MLTAHAALHDVGRLQPGERVGVRGAAGSVGRVAVQLALAAGAEEVIGIVSSQERGAAVPAGARAVAAGSPDELRARLHGAGLDLLVDTVGGLGLAACLGAMRARGRIVLVGYAGGVRLELDATELLVHDVSLLPLGGAPESFCAQANGGFLFALFATDSLVELLPSGARGRSVGNSSTGSSPLN